MNEYRHHLGLKTIFNGVDMEYSDAGIKLNILTMLLHDDDIELSDILALMHFNTEYLYSNNWILLRDQHHSKKRMSLNK